MANDTDEIRVYANGGVYTAEVGTTFPATVETAIDANDWTNLGYLSEEGPRFSFGRETVAIKGWQSRYDLRRILTETPTSLTAGLKQWNRESLKMALGEGEYTEDAPGAYRFTPDTSIEWERAVLVEMIDGDDIVRFQFPRMALDGAVEFAGIRTDSSDFDVTLMTLDPGDGIEPFEFTTNIETFAPVGS